MTGRSILTGLVGANILKSLSPALHDDAFEAAGLRGHYHLMDLEQQPGRRLEQVLAAVKTAGFAGINVTYPVKQAIVPLLDEISSDARQIGAVNTVAITDGGVAIGYNTDRSGFRRSLEEGLGRSRVKGQTVLLVGAGGAGRAVAFALLDLGAETILVNDADEQRATALVVDLMTHCGATRSQLARSAADALRQADGVVNATPIGMLGLPGSAVPVAALRASHWVGDVVYTPMETQLIAAARVKGCRVLTGGGMCVHQAADAFKLFTGVEPDVDRMHRTFADALVRRDAAFASVA